jgi:hypothetical protein
MDLPVATAIPVDDDEGADFLAAIIKNYSVFPDKVVFILNGFKGGVELFGEVYFLVDAFS